MLLVNRYGACILPEDIDKALHAKAVEIADLVKANDMTPEDARIFEQVAIESLVNRFAENRLRKACAMRTVERKVLEEEHQKSGDITKQREVLSEKKLNIWNGRGFRHLNGTEYEHIYVCAKSVSEVIRLCKQAGYDVTRCEIEQYWTKGCWGNAMTGITPEVGVWAAPKIEGGHGGTVVRLV
jgi:hypothetical protein